MRKIPIVSGEIYHIFNRGVNRQDIFFNESDYRRFMLTAIHYKRKRGKFSYEINMHDDPGSLEARVEIFAYCLMPNHFHLLIRQLEEGGIVSYIQQVMNSYVHYCNEKHDRVGPLFQGPYKNVLVESDEQFKHVSRYIHLNPLIADLVSKLVDYDWSSYLAYVKGIDDKLCDKEFVLEQFDSIRDYEKFVMDQADYQLNLERIKSVIIE